MDSFDKTRRRPLTNQAAARRDLAGAAGDRGPALLATWARWDRFEQQRAADPARHRLGRWLGRALSRFRAAAPAATAFRRGHGEV